MKKQLMIAALLALAACDSTSTTDEAQAPDAASATTEEASNPDAGFEAVAPGEYEIVRTDGTIDRLTVHPGLTWSMVPATGEPTGGTIFAQGGKNCFVTEGVEGHRCFSGTEPDAEGTITVTGDDGETAVVRPAKGPVAG